MCPSKVVVLAVEDLLCSSSLVVVLYDLLIGHVPVVGQYTTVCVLAVEEVKLLALLLALPLHDEAAMLHVLETLEGERLHVVLASLRELTCGQQQLDEQLVQFLSCVEIIDIARLFCRV